MNNDQERNSTKRYTCLAHLHRCFRGRQLCYKKVKESFYSCGLQQENGKVLESGRCFFQNKNTIFKRHLQPVVLFIPLLFAIFNPFF